MKTSYPYFSYMQFCQHINCLLFLPGSSLSQNLIPSYFDIHIIFEKSQDLIFSKWFSWDIKRVTHYCKVTERQE